MRLVEVEISQGFKGHPRPAADVMTDRKDDDGQWSWTCNTVILVICPPQFVSVIKMLGDHLSFPVRAANMYNKLSCPVT